MLADNSRLLVVSEIIKLFNSYLQEENNLKRAVDAAFELSNEQIEEINFT